MIICPSVHFNTVKRDALPSYRDFSQIGTGLSIKREGAHAQILSSFRSTIEPIQHHYSFSFLTIKKKSAQLTAWTGALPPCPRAN